ncbi:MULTISPECIES: fumarylacetoacetate hydrolase family protein [Ralstonia]|jgi:5-oxopent-3-ene-1,2,5-tricarboxylate decarboxylase/2-hydroxyhepta-2,4-diene-1,7-dioate isomerase|uniref:5-carboxy-2-oxohept-3-enedioate decarboxylase HpaG1 subunit n=1 Tax=Ralstonia pickettii OR214 TaxID=1264675 RepID=R0CEQ0_RALPI|nr:MULTISPECIES: fumarylacetoacetate hydrolase family protein [Ralstonia]MEA3269174.1 fumarylacetoacetate hydrolase family protein [Pseudomonadota bacterium]ENZ75110.1 5-carboxy-2-oxohept-3-enedioate decarboxylase HpaG1 subunit [Ralstonia pickettii OR214]MBL4777472.1 fumarylacetoacetate hydrolase family protein [Ralstonia sp.]MCM3582610.1 fumarylacetoacetate hydrolase family protein [Ralstonia pickettii]MDR9382777.1 fumarylacetoacetate hydrolase family protein [Ralstonia sp. 11b]
MRRARVTLPDGRVRETLFASATEPADSWRWLPPVEGTVVGALLNYRGELDALSDTLSAPPYQAPPKAPILYLKPANTRIGHGHEVALPADVDGVWAGACLGVAISCTATRVPAQHAADFIAGYTIVNDLTVPHASYYRPAIRHKCRDGFCPMGPWVVDRDDVPNADALDITVRINGEVKQRANTSTLVRPIAQLLADVTAFMTLESGDVLLVGMPENPPLARAGDRIDIDIAHIGTLTTALIRHAQEASR